MGLGVMIIQPKLRQGRRWGIGVGTLLILLGLVAIGFAPTVNIPVSFLLGWLFLFAGFAQGVYVFQYHQQCRQNEYFVWKLLLGILYLQAGMFVLLSPVISGLTLALAVGISIFSQSIIQVLSAFDMRPRVGWSCNLFGGFVGVVLSIFVMAQWPSGAASSLGLWFGINILVDGLGLLVHASIVR